MTTPLGASLTVQHVVLPDFSADASAENERVLNVNNLRDRIPWAGTPEAWYDYYNFVQSRYDMDYYWSPELAKCAVNPKPVKYSFSPAQATTMREIGALGIARGVDSLRRLYGAELRQLTSDIETALCNPSEAGNHDLTGNCTLATVTRPAALAPPTHAGSASSPEPPLAFPWYDDDNDSVLPIVIDEPVVVKLGAEGAGCPVRCDDAAIAALPRGEAPNSAHTGIDLISASQWAGGMFVRTNACSPKDALGNVMRPLFSVQAAVEAVVCSSRCMREFNANPHKVHSLLLSSWQPAINGSSEFRVFVHEGIVTALSQYVWHKVFPWMQSDGDVAAAAHAIIAFWHHSVVPVVPFVEGIMDVAVELTSCGTWDVKLVEFNPFGLEFASGSALFHWQRDVTLLYAHAPAAACDTGERALPGDKCGPAGAPKTAYDYAEALARQSRQPVTVRIAVPSSHPSAIHFVAPTSPSA